MNNEQLAEAGSKAVQHAVEGNEQTKPVPATQSGGEKPAVEPVTTKTPAEEFAMLGLSPIKGVIVRPLGLEFDEDVECSDEDLIKIMQAANKGEARFAFCTGDALVRGRFGDKTYPEIAKKLRMNPATLRTKRYVSDNVPLSIRIDTLSWMHHRLVAPFHDDKDKQERLLKIALDKNLTVDQFRKKVRGKRAKVDDKAPEQQEGTTAMAHAATLISELQTNWLSWKPETRKAVATEVRRMLKLVSAPPGPKAPANSLDTPATGDVGAPAATPAAAETGTAAVEPAVTPTSAADVAAAVNPAQVMAEMADVKVS